MSGHRPWSLVKRNKPAQGIHAAPTPAPPSPTTPTDDLVWGPVTFREAPEDLLRNLIRVIDEGRITDADVEKMIDWTKPSNHGYTLTWTEVNS